MMKPRHKRICFFTGTRADYGLLRPIIERMKAFPEAKISLLITGSHLSVEHGSTSSEIDLNGIEKVEQVKIIKMPTKTRPRSEELLVAHAMSKGMIGFVRSLHRLKPDMLVILGDRYEALVAAMAASVTKTPIAHIHGGELSLGAIDDVFRHSISKMSHIHFTSTDSYRKRVIQMGEHPERVFNVGAPGVENAVTMKLLSRSEVLQRLSRPQNTQFVMATFHPPTLEKTEPEEQLRNLIAALQEKRDLVTIFTGANADAGGTKFNLMLETLARENPDRFTYRPSLGSLLYLSALKHCSFVIGNSSSGIIEAPSFHIPVIDIGSRQSGRIRAASVIHCLAEKSAIENAISKACSKEAKLLALNTQNPYQRDNTSSTIAHEIVNCNQLKILDKGFYDISVQ